MPTTTDVQLSPAQIQQMFDSIARRYDLFNRLMSFGMDKFWRIKVLENIPSGSRLLDLGCGTGDLSLKAAKRLGHSGEVVGLDFSGQMLAVAKRRYEALGSPMNGGFRLLQMSAEELPLDGAPFDYVVSGFVLRNLYERIDRVLAGVYASLRAGGELRLLDFTEPSQPWRRDVFRVYMNTAANLYGHALFGKDFDGDYLANSAARFVKPEAFVEKLRMAGFKDISARRFMLGAVVLYRAVKP